MILISSVHHYSRPSGQRSETSTMTKVGTGRFIKQTTQEELVKLEAHVNIPEGADNPFKNIREQVAKADMAFEHYETEMQLLTQRNQILELQLKATSIGLKQAKEDQKHKQDLLSKELEAFSLLKSKENFMIPEELDIKIAPPEDYDGSPGNFLPFITQCELVFQGQTKKFASGKARTIYALSYMNKGTALRWKQKVVGHQENFLKDLISKATEKGIGLWEAVKSLLEETFLNISTKTETQQKLLRIKQGAQTVEEYNTEFEILAMDAELDEPVMLMLWKQGLKPTIKQKIYESGNIPKERNEWVKRAKAIDLGRREFQAESAPYPQRERIRNTMIRPAGKPKLNSEEYQKRQMKGLCFNCGGKGHQLRNCEVDEGRTAKPKEPTKETTQKPPGNIQHKTPSNKNYAQIKILGEPQNQGFELPIRLEEQKQTLIALIDSGATQSFIHHNIVRSLKLNTKKLECPISILNVDGTTNSHGLIREEVKTKLSVGSWSGEISLLVADLYDSQVILGADWLVKANPQINWKDNSMEFNRIRMTTQNKDQIPPQYQDYSDVFSEEKATRLPTRKKWDMEIELEIPPQEYQSKIGRGGIYAMTHEERKELKEWVEEQLAKGYIKPSRSPIAAPVFYVPKKDGKKRLVQNYKKLNAHTKKDSYPIPIMRTLTERLEGARIFTALDLRWGYHNVRIKEGDEWKAAFSTPMGLYEPTVMLFGLSNSPATFQRMMDEILRGTEHFAVVYLDDILIYSRNLQEHREHVKEILQRLRENDLFAKPEKCVFETDTLEYLGTWIEKGHLRMDKDKVEAIIAWPTPRRVKDVRSFLGFANFYRHFIKGFTNYSRVLTNLTKKTQKWKWSSKEEEAFNHLKKSFTQAPVLIIPDENKQFHLETDASDYGIGAVLSQEGEDGKIHPVAFLSTRMDEAERNYEIYDKEMLAVIKALKKWRHHLMGSKLPVKVYSDHKNLTYFKRPQDLSPRQARWYTKLLNYDIEFIHQSAQRSARSDALSRNPEWKPEEPDNQGILFLKAEWDRSPEINHIIQDPLINELVKERDYDPEVSLALKNLKNHGPKRIQDSLSEWQTQDGLILYQGRIYVPKNEEIKRKILRRHHDSLGAGHPGREKTLDLVSRNYWWPSMTTFVHQYVDGCIECQRNKILPRKPQGLMGRHEIPEQPWEVISVDFITDLPESKGKTAIFTVVDYHTKQGHFIPTTKDVDSAGLYELYLHHVWKLHGTSRKLVSDRGPQFASEFTKTLQEGLGIETALSTAHHPQTDGQTERLNQTVETFLRIFSSYHQDNWVDLIPFAEFAYNNQKHSSTGWSPFYVLYGCDPNFEINVNPTIKVPAVKERLQMLKELREEVQVTLQRIQDQQARQLDNGQTHKPYNVGEKVWLEGTNIQTTAPTKKLGAKRLGPFNIEARIGHHAYKLKLPPGMKGVHPVFHETLLRPFKKDIIKGRTQDPPPPVELIEGGNRYEVEEILDSRKVGRGVQYLVKWEGYGQNENSWEPSRNVDEATEALEEFHHRYPQKPKAKICQMRAFDSKKGVMSRTQHLITKIQQICQEIRDIKGSRTYQKPQQTFIKPQTSPNPPYAITITPIKPYAQMPLPAQRKVNQFSRWSLVYR